MSTVGPLLLRVRLAGAKKQGGEAGLNRAPSKSTEVRESSGETGEEVVKKTKTATGSAAERLESEGCEIKVCFARDESV